MVKRENFSKKRKAILTALRSTKTHPTAEWLYTELKPEYPDLSLGTVYRNLRMFCDSGRAVSVGVINGQEHFDGDVAPHSHFICDVCNSVIDVPKEFFRRSELLQVTRSTGHNVTSANVVFHGVCAACKAEAEKDE